MSYTLETIRLLIAHDSQDEAEQLMNTLRNAGKATRAELVLNEDDLLRALKSGTWELLLCRPTFGDSDFKKVLAHLNRLGKPVPVLLLADEFSPASFREALEEGARAAVPADDRDLLMLMIDRVVEDLRVRKELQHTELALRDAEKRLNVLMDQSRDAIAYVVDGMHIHANEAYVELFGYDSPDDLAGMPIMDMVSSSHHEELKNLLRSRAQDESKTHELECRGVTTSGEEFDAVFTFSPSTYDGEACTQIVIHRSDADEEQLEEKLREMSKTDQTTGLYNRSWFMEELDQAVSEAVTSGQLAAVVYLRLDDFEQHQTTVGIDGADQLLHTVADFLREQMGSDTIMSRVGGEDFAVLLQVKDLDEAQERADALRKGVAELMPEVGSRTLRLSASIGVAFAREDSRGSQAVMTKALECCNRAEEANDGTGNAVHVHNPMDDVESGSSEAILMELKQALEDGSFKLLYQPIMSMADEAPPFYESFVYLPQEKGEDLKPSEFMPVAAEHGLAPKVDRWVILRALRAAAEQEESLRLIINISGHSLEDASFTEWVVKAVKASGISAGRVVFQFSEIDAKNFLKQVNVFSEQIHKAGARISTSRFAGDLHPFQLFEHVQVDMVKFDGTYTQELGNAESREKFGELIKQASDSDKEVLVGFIESAQQMQALWTMDGVDHLQGYYLQPPSPQIEVSDG
jgi:diguanylate cyclase (GGDEF)-like protein/PAS domain S-box-containing protein